MSTRRTPKSLDLESAAALVELPPAAVEALAGAGYLASTPQEGPGLWFERADVEAFVARNSLNGSGGSLPADLAAGMEPDELVQLLDERAEHMAARLLKMYGTVFPPAASWPPRMQSKFVARTKDRFEAILAIAALGDSFDPALVEDLHSIGASAARNGVRLPQILTLLRVARDLVVQNAIELSATGERPGGHALSLLLTRILPAMDRLGDSLTAGYWEAMFPA